MVMDAQLNRYWKRPELLSPDPGVGRGERGYFLGEVGMRRPRLIRGQE